MKNTTLIFVTHRLDAIKDADNILFLKRGRVIESGSHNYLIKLKKEYYNLINKNYYEKQNYSFNQKIFE